MIIPKSHFAYLNEMDEETGRHLWTVTQRTAEALRHSGVRCEGLNREELDQVAGQIRAAYDQVWAGKLVA